MKRTFFGIMFFVSIVFTLGTLCAYDYDTISTTQMWIQTFIGAVVLVVSAYMVRLEDKRNGKDM